MLTELLLEGIIHFPPLLQTIRTESLSSPTIPPFAALNVSELQAKGSDLKRP